MKKFSPLLFLGSSLLLLTGCGGGGNITTPPPSATHFSVTAPANVPSAVLFSITVTALDSENQTVTNYSGTVHFSSSDPHAQLPPDSVLESGTKMLPATLTTGGSQMVTATDKAAATVVGNSNSINVGLLPGAFLVEWFGAKGDGVTDDTTAIQSAINAASAAGGGSVVFKVARYFTTGTFLVPGGVILCGTVDGPFDVKGVDPGATAIAPTLLVTNSNTPFITLNGLGAGVSDLLFHYPNQVKTSASNPIVYPYTIKFISAAGKVVRSTVTNAYNFLDMQLGRKMAQDLYIGAFNIGIHIDNDEDFTILQNIHSGVPWDDVEAVTYPSPIDAWVLNNGTALVVDRMDSLELHDFFVYSRFAGILLTDSPDTSLNPRCGWGNASNVNLEAVQYGVIAISATGQGYKFTNLQVAAAPGLGQAAVQLRGGGTCSPEILVNGGSVRGTWALGAFPAPQAGNLTHVNIIGSDLP